MVTLLGDFFFIIFFLSNLVVICFFSGALDATQNRRYTTVTLFFYL